VIQVGPVRVAVAGMDVTTKCFCARQDRAGTNFADEKGDLKEFAEKMKKLGEWSKSRCDLLALTLHWGGNWVRQTQASHKKMARIAFENGVDLILGHSAHRLQGIEVVDGKPVVYDMGNLLFDCKLKPEGQSSALFRFTLSKQEVNKIEILPIEALNGHSILAKYEEAQKTLKEMNSLCSTFGTELEIQEDLLGRPKGVVNISSPKAATKGKYDPSTPCFKPSPQEIEIPVAQSLKTLPKDVKELSPPIPLAPGVELIAAKVPKNAPERGLLFLGAWFRVTQKVPCHVMPAYLIKPEALETEDGKVPRRGTPWYTRHDAMDWALPFSRTIPGQIIEDRFAARLQGLHPGKAKVYALVIDTTQPEKKRILGEPHLLGVVEISPVLKDAPK